MNVVLLSPAHVKTSILHAISPFPPSPLSSDIAERIRVVLGQHVSHPSLSDIWRPCPVPVLRGTLPSLTPSRTRSTVDYSSSAQTTETSPVVSRPREIHHLQPTDKICDECASARFKDVEEEVEVVVSLQNMETQTVQCESQQDHEQKSQPCVVCPSSDVQGAPPVMEVDEGTELIPKSVEVDLVHDPVPTEYDIPLVTPRHEVFHEVKRDEFDDQNTEKDSNLAPKKLDFSGEKKRYRPSMAATDARVLHVPVTPQSAAKSSRRTSMAFTKEFSRSPPPLVKLRSLAKHMPSPSHVDKDLMSPITPFRRKQLNKTGQSLPPPRSRALKPSFKRPTTLPSLKMLAAYVAVLSSVVKPEELPNVIFTTNTQLYSAGSSLPRSLSLDYFEGRESLARSLPRESISLRSLGPGSLVLDAPLQKTQESDRFSSIALQPMILTLQDILLGLRASPRKPRDKLAAREVVDVNFPVHKACALGWYECVLLLLFHGYSPCTVDVHNHHVTALHEACRRGHTEIVSLLLESGADLNAVDSFGNPPLYYACLKAHEDVALILVNHGADVIGSNVAGMTPLVIASSYGLMDVVSAMLAKGVSTIETGEYGYAPLHAACERGHCAVVVELVRAGADVNQMSCVGNTPLHYACEGGFGDIVKLLLSKGACPDICNKRGLRPLDVARGSTRKIMMDLNKVE